MTIINWKNGKIKWQMKLNPSKCYITISSKKCYNTPGYTPLCTRPLKVVDCHPYLGAEIIDSKLRWDKHIKNIHNKTNHVLGLPKRDLSSCPRDVKTTAYKTLVRPVIDYASLVWENPSPV